MYEKDQMQEVAGVDSCSLCMKTITQELKSIQLDYVDGNLQILNISYSEFFENKVGNRYGCKLIRSLNCVI